MGSEAHSIRTTETVTANSSSSNSITVPNHPSGIHRVSFAFEGNHGNEVKLVQSSGDSNGIVVPAGFSGTRGPFDVENAPVFLYADSSTDVDLAVVDGELNDESGVVQTVNAGAVNGNFSPSTHLSSSATGEEQVSSNESICHSVVANVGSGPSAGEYFIQLWDGATQTGSQSGLVWQENFTHDGSNAVNVPLEGPDPDKPFYFSSQLRVALSSDGDSFTAVGSNVFFSVAYED